LILQFFDILPHHKWQTVKTSCCSIKHRRDKDCSALSKSDAAIVPFSINFSRLTGSLSLANKKITFHGKCIHVQGITQMIGTEIDSPY
jgi:hypothetical protein